MLPTPGDSTLSRPSPEGRSDERPMPWASPISARENHDVLCEGGAMLDRDEREEEEEEVVEAM